ncbi:MAG: TIGR02597 family protein [Verrucomicrobiae bacterium]|nr:TIGR02597 family protein [Verrucomicrobiae bacterium]
MNSAKLAVSLGAVTLALTGITASAATNVVSDPVGFYKIAIPTGPNMISAPLPNISAFKGTVASVSGNNINFSGTPGFTSSAFGPVTVGGMPRGQFLLIVCKDADEIDGSPANVAGDWWVISNNSTTNVTVEPSGDVVGNFVEEGDTVEIRKLTSLKDIFWDRVRLHLG